MNVNVQHVKRTERDKITQFCPAKYRIFAIVFLVVLAILS